MPFFRTSDCFYISNERIVIKEWIGKGEQADIYSVINVDRGRLMAAKHMYGAFSTNSQLFYKKLKILSQYQAPHRSMVWPQMVSDYDYDTNSLIYIMDLLPEGYKPIAYAMKPKNWGVLTDKQRIILSSRLVEAFATLHKKGFFYCDISGDNILYKLDQNGNIDIKIIDCDNVSIESQNLGLLGSGLFRAPEVLLGCTPNFKSDAHALAVAIFRLLVGTHPLDGTLTKSVHYTPQMVTEYFGYKPMYIFGKDSTNLPCCHQYTVLYNRLPPNVKLYFDVMFCNNSLHNSNDRPGLETLYTIFREEERNVQ